MNDRRQAITAAVLLASLGLAGGARAHSELRSSVPANGARLASAPTEITLRFHENAQVTAIRLFAPDGTEVPVRRDRSLPSQPEHKAGLPVLAPGLYRVEWRAISADGHPIGGTIRFTVLGA
jgi:methionine-rich copper-binding protein CopC